MHEQKAQQKEEEEFVFKKPVEESKDNKSKRKPIKKRKPPQRVGSFKFDARQNIKPSKNYAERRRGSVVESRSEKDQEFINSFKKEVIVRTPR